MPTPTYPFDWLYVKFNAPLNSSLSLKINCLFSEKNSGVTSICALILGSVKIESDDGVTPVEESFCFNSPEVLKDPLTLVNVTIPLFDVENSTIPVTPVLPTCVIIWFAEKLKLLPKVIVVFFTVSVVALTPAPIKSNWVILLNPPTRVFSSKTLIDPGIKSPWLRIQNLSPGNPSTATTTYWLPDFTGFAPSDDGPTRGSPRSGSACSNPRYLYLWVSSSSLGGFFLLPLNVLLAKYCAIIYFIPYWSLEYS